mgnify:CR=1 FL=1
MMVAHFILAHAYPDQLCRLVNRLSYSNTVFFIHVDLKSNIHDFELALANNLNVHFIQNRVDIQWATYSMVDATINGFIFLLIVNCLLLILSFFNIILF